MPRLSTGVGKRNAAPNRTTRTSTPAGVAAGVGRVGQSNRITATGGRHVGSSGAGRVSTPFGLAAGVPRLGGKPGRMSQTKISGAVNGAQAGHGGGKG